MAADLFEQVIAKDPAFAPAYAGLADAWAVDVDQPRAACAPDEAFAIMQPAAQKALQLDPLLAEGHAAMGVVLARDRNWTRCRSGVPSRPRSEPEPLVDSYELRHVDALAAGQGRRVAEPASRQRSVRIRCRSTSKG